MLDELEAVEIALSSVVRRWENGPSPEIREEIMLEAYEPVLHLLIRTERRGRSVTGKPAHVPPQASRELSATTETQADVNSGN